MAGHGLDEDARDRRSRRRGRAASSLLAAGALVLATLLVPAGQAAVATPPVALDQGLARATTTTTPPPRTPCPGSPRPRETADPTTPMQAAVGNAAVAKQRREPDPRARPVGQGARPPGRAAGPLRDGVGLLRAPVDPHRPLGARGPATGSRRSPAPAPVGPRCTSAPPTSAATCCTATGRTSWPRTTNPLTDRVVSADSPSSRADLVVRRRGSSYTFQVLASGDYLTTGPGGAITTSSTPGTFGLHTTTGCARVARGRDQRQRPHLPGRLEDPGGARPGRRAHPRHGLRVPRRRRALRPTLAPLRRDRRAQGLPRPLRRERSGRRARGPAQQRHPRHRPRPGGLADVQGLAGTALADPRGHLLQVDGALLARRPAGVHEPAGRERQALPGLPDQAQLLRRHGLHPPAGQGHAALRALHRRAVRRSGQGLVPHRPRPLPGAPGHQRGQARGGHGHRDQRAVRVHPEGRRPRPLVHQGDHRPPARRGPCDGRLADGAGQQVRQRALGRRR